MFEEESILETNPITESDETTIERIDLVDEEPVTSEMPITPEEIEYLHQKHTAKDEVITPENTTNNTKSTGVSTYVSIPDIQEEKQLCDNNFLTVWDKINMWSAIILVVIALIFFTRKSFTNLIKKITNIFEKYKFILNIFFLIFTVYIFLYPTFFNNGISGKINIFTMLEFVAFIIINSALLTYIAIKYLKGKNKVFKDRNVVFSGIFFLKRSLWIFTLTAILFFFFTETELAFSFLYFCSFLTSIITFNQLDFTKLNEISKLPYIMLSIQIIIIGSLLGLYPVLIAGSILTGYYLSDKNENITLKTTLKDIL